VSPRPARDIIENQIITAMIVSTTFNAQIDKIFNPDFMVNPYAKIVAKWCRDYFKEYKEAPGLSIKSIFELERGNLDRAEAEIVGIFLTKLNEDYVEEGGNPELIYDRAVEYFGGRDLDLRLDRAIKLKDAGRIKEARELLLEKTVIEKISHNWQTVFTSEDVVKTYAEKERKAIVSFPGVLGELIGDLERGWLVGILGSFKKGKCVAEGTNVLLANGSLKPIEQLFLEKKKIVSLGKNKKFIPKKIEHCLYNGVKAVYEIETRIGRKVELTKNHPLLTPLGWKELSCLKEGDYIAVSKIIPLEGKEEAEDYKIKLLAYLLAEGGLTGSNIIFTNKNKDIQKDFKDIIEKVGDAVVRRDSLTVAIKAGKGKEKKKHACFTREWMRELGLLGKLSKQKEIPDFVFKLNNERIALFLSVLFSCDGSTWREGERNNILIEYVSSNEKFCYQVNHLLLRFGIVGKVRNKIYKGFPSWNVIIADTRNIRLFEQKIGFLFEKKKKLKKFMQKMSRRCERGLTDSIPFLYLKEHFPFSQLRKIKTKNGKSLLKQCFKKKGYISTKVLEMVASDFPSLKKICEEDIFWDKIKKISYKGRKRTYDLTISKTHNFLANDVVVHNTFYKMDLAVNALLNKLNVAFISLEMNEVQIKDRFYRRISGVGLEEQYLFPMFDCLYNQVGTCTKPQRENRIALKKKPEDIIRFKEIEGYKPCSYCREGGQKFYKPEVWFESIKTPLFSMKSIQQKVKAFSLMFGNRLRIKAYPRFSASIDDISRDLDVLEHLEGFIPDVIFVDYATILRPGRFAGKEKREIIDEIWMTLARMASERHCLVVSATQGTRGSIKKHLMEEEDIAEWIGILAHVDVFIALSQTPIEKEKGVIRFNVLEHRHKKFIPDKSVMVLQHLETGQTYIDSEFSER
jgi:intein/homing endonuclease